MLRRSILELSSRRSIGRISPRLTTQIPLYLSSRKEFSVASQPNPSKGSGSTAKPPDSGNNLSKVLVGSIALGAASIAAFQTGYLDKYLTNEQSNDLDNTNPIPVVHEESQQPKAVENNLQDVAVLEKVDDQNVQDSEILSPNVDPYYTRREEKTDPETRDAISDNNISNYDTLSIGSKEIIQENISEKTQDVEPAMEHNEVAPVIEENVMNFEQNQQLDNTNMPEGNLNDNKEAGPLLDAYLIRDEPGENAAESSYLEKEIAETVKDSDDISTSKDEKLVLDFLQAIHTAEKRQADLDAHVFSEEKRLLKEKYEKELKDARARELMYAERETILDKELHKEKLKAATALKSLQEMLEEEFKMEIERKESERELELNKCKDLAKAELAAAIASEKASQIAKLEEANLNINALCMAFYARSEEARQSHSVHKLALGALALEDALSKGLPIQKEVDALNSFIHGIDKDSLLGLVMESLPQDTLKNGTDTILQLNHKFDGLKGTLRHFSLMPPGGGGILAHSLAYIASLLKVKEAGKSSDGIESLINRVDKLLADGKLIEAAETLENGLKGTQAAQIVGDWAQQARNRAITEQALTLLQSYATSLTHT